MDVGAQIINAKVTGASPLQRVEERHEYSGWLLDWDCVVNNYKCSYYFSDLKYIFRTKFCMLSVTLLIMLSKSENCNLL
jgi:hypothetical protein